MADRAEIMANTPNILARNRRGADRANTLARGHREADTRSAAAGRNRVEANPQNPATREVEIGAAVIGAAIRGIMEFPVAHSFLSVDLVIRTTGVGTPVGPGAFLTHLATAIILMGIILRMDTIMVLRTTRVGTPVGPGAFLTRLTMAMILMGTILRMGTIMVTTATPLTDTAMDLQSPNCRCGWSELATTMAPSMG